MARLIFKCNYIRNKNNKTKGYIKNILKYIAIRENVMKIKNNKLKATVNQENFINKHLTENLKNSFEYEEYIKNKTMINASMLIDKIVEENIENPEIYIKYIATRPRVKKIEEHGLFTEKDEILNLKKIGKEVGNHKGAIWLPIISLKREDAEKTGFDKLEAWKNLIESNKVEIAKAMKIPLEKFKWYGAFHDESYHPHMHMIVYSTDGKSGFLTEKGIESIKSILSKTIFKNELYEIYSKQTKERNNLRDETLKYMKMCIRDISVNKFDNNKLENLIQNLFEKLEVTKGKKVYGYLKADVKNIVDEIVDEICNNKQINNCYNNWWKLKKEILNIYENVGDEIPKLSSQKELKHIKNIVISEVVKFNKSKKYYEKEEEKINKLLKEYYENKNKPKYFNIGEEYILAKEYLEDKDYENAEIILKQEEEQGNPFAMYQLGKIYEEHNKLKALKYYKKAFNKFKEYKEYEQVKDFVESIYNYKIEPIEKEYNLLIKNISLSLLEIFENTIKENFKNKPYNQVDRKRIRKIREKKSKQGYNRDDNIEFNIKI